MTTFLVVEPVDVLRLRPGLQNCEGFFKVFSQVWMIRMETAESRIGCAGPVSRVVVCWREYFGVSLCQHDDEWLALRLIGSVDQLIVLNRPLKGRNGSATVFNGTLTLKTPVFSDSDDLGYSPKTVCQSMLYHRSRAVKTHSNRMYIRA